jgi:hypothetical protein
VEKKQTNRHAAIQEYCHKALQDSQLVFSIDDLTLSYIKTHFIACSTIVDPDQPEHQCCLNKICTVRFLLRNNQLIQKVDPDQTA